MKAKKQRVQALCTVIVRLSKIKIVSKKKKVIIPLYMAWRVKENYLYI
jgi:hypothetical protein